MFAKEDDLADFRSLVLEYPVCLRIQIDLLQVGLCVRFAVSAQL